MGDKIDFSLLAVVLNAGVSVILLGGLILGINPAAHNDRCSWLWYEHFIPSHRTQSGRHCAKEQI